MIEKIIDWCNANRFIVFIAVAGLIFAGIWSIDLIPLDALPDISDVQVIIHTPWMGQPPNVIEDQVTYPIVTTMLAAPHVKAVRAQTMFNDSYVFVVFEDGTDIYWARSRVLEYMQQLEGQLPSGVHPVIGPDATGAGWVYEYLLIDRSHNLNLADLRSLQDWHVRYELETVPGVAEVSTIGGFERQYQVKLDPKRLLALHVPLQTVIDRIRASNSEVGGRVLEMTGADYLIRGVGYIKSLADIEKIPVASNNGTPVLVRDLGVVSYGPNLREGVAEWNGEGEAVGGIVVMRYGQNALKVINGIKERLEEVRKTLPPGVEIVSGYDRAGLIQDSIDTLKRDLLEEAAIVSLVIIVFLFHFRSALIPILTLPLAVLATFIPMYYFQGELEHHVAGSSRFGDRRARRDASIVMVENGYRHLSERQAEAEKEWKNSKRRPERQKTSPVRCQAGRSTAFLLADYHRRVNPSPFPSRSAGRPDVPTPRRHQNARYYVFVDSRDHYRSGLDDSSNPREAAPARRRESRIAVLSSPLSSSNSMVSASSVANHSGQHCLPHRNSATRIHNWQSIHASSIRRFGAFHAYCSSRHFDHFGVRSVAEAGPNNPHVS